MGKEIKAKPVGMTPVVMQMLEDKGLIIRLCPGHHALEAKTGETKVSKLYHSDIQYGSHKLIAVTVNRSTLDAFGTHPDHEEFLLIGDPDTKPMYLVLALCEKDELDRKIREAALECSDFIALRVKYNDPEVSFFTMLKNVPHGEATADEDGKPASFYVTEPNAMTLDKTDFRDYELSVGQVNIHES